jgi:predicted NBD/HSP70 family sugar kinase
MDDAERWTVTGVPAPHTVDSSWMRVTNLAAVLAAVIRDPPTSRARLVAETGLTKATISSLVDELSTRGWIRSGGQNQEGIGRPRQLLVPNADQGFIVGAEINVDYLAVLVVDFACHERRLARIPLDIAQLGPVAAVRQLARQLLDAVASLDADPHRILGVGLAVPGVVGPNSILVVAPNLEWENVDVGSVLETELRRELGDGVPIIVENEANLAALAEQSFGSCASVRNFVYLSSEQGVGAGIVVDGEVFRGTHGAAGEVGHVTIDPHGPRCQCGKLGCWQVFTSQSALGTLPLDEATRVQLERYLAIGLGNLVQMYDPEVVVLGGFFADALGARRAELIAEVGEWVMGDFARPLRIEISTFGQDSSIWGGVAMVLQWLAARPRSIDSGDRLIAT